MCPDSLRAALLAFIFAAAAFSCPASLAAQQASVGVPGAPSPEAPAPAVPALRRIEWEPVEGARAYEIEVATAAGAPLHRSRIETNWAELPLDPGSYRIRITVLNRFLKPSSSSAWSELSVIRVEKPDPSLVEPRELPSGSAEIQLRIQGRGIYEETRARLERGGLVVEGLRAGGSGNLALFTFDLSRAPPGYFDLFLVNPAGASNRLRAAVVLDAPEASAGVSGPAATAEVAGAAEGLPEVPVPVLHEKPADLEGDVGAAVLDEAQSVTEPAIKPAIETAIKPEIEPSVEPAKPADKGFDPRFVVAVGWTGGTLLDSGFTERYEPGYAGGTLRMLAEFGGFFPGSVLARCFALEFAAEGLRYGSPSGALTAGLLGAGFGLRTPFRFPVNLVLRFGGGASLTEIASSSGLGSDAPLTLDASLYGGAGLRWTMDRYSLTLGAGWVGTFYLDAFVNQARAELLLGFGL